MRVTVDPVAVPHRPTLITLASPLIIGGIVRPSSDVCARMNRGCPKNAPAAPWWGFQGAFHDRAYRFRRRFWNHNRVGGGAALGPAAGSLGFALVI